MLISRLNQVATWLAKPSRVILFFCGSVAMSFVFMHLPYDVGQWMLDSLWGYDLATAQQHFQAMGEAGRATYLWSSLVLDTIFPLLYVSFLLGFLRYLGYQHHVVLGLPVLLLLVDLAENSQIAWMNHHYEQLSAVQVALASYVTQLKWVCVLACVLCIGFAVVKKIINTIKPS